MPQHPAARPTRSDPAHGPFPDRGAVALRPARDLTVNKLLAGAGAAATSAVLGSFFGAAGTVAGAAFGSVASTVASAVYQRYLDRTRDTIVARIRPVADGASPSELTVPMQRGPEGETVRLRVEPVVPPVPIRRRWWFWLGATVLLFAIGLLVVTGIEWVKGSTLTSNDSGTSVGRVLGGGPATTAEPTTAPAAPAGGPTSDATPQPTVAPSGTADPRQDTTGGPGSSAVPQVGVPQTGAPPTGAPQSGAPGAGSVGSPGAPAAPGLSGLPGGTGSGR